MIVTQNGEKRSKKGHLMINLCVPSVSESRPIMLMNLLFGQRDTAQSHTVYSNVVQSSGY